MSKLGIGVELRLTATSNHLPKVHDLPRHVEAMRAALGELALMILHDQGATGKWRLDCLLYPEELLAEAKKPL